MRFYLSHPLLEIQLKQSDIPKPRRFMASQPTYPRRNSRPYDQTLQNNTIQHNTVLLLQAAWLHAGQIKMLHAANNIQKDCTPLLLRALIMHWGSKTEILCNFFLLALPPPLSAPLAPKELRRTLFVAYTSSPALHEHVNINWKTSGGCFTGPPKDGYSTHISEGGYVRLTSHNFLTFNRTPLFFLLRGMFFGGFKQSNNRTHVCNFLSYINV